MERILSEGFRGVVVACSGGADSTALFRLLCEFAKSKKNFELAVGHVQFGLRGEESALDERFSRALAAEAGVGFKCLTVGEVEKAQKAGKSLQEWAREVRREAWRAWAEDGWATALAHHADDQAETVLMRMARGAAPQNLRGMRVWEAPVWRPLLRERKAALRAWLEREGHAWREDRTNATGMYDRNVVRHEVLATLERLYPGATERIVACAEEAADPSPSVRRILEVLPKDRALSRAWLASAAAMVESGSGRLTVPGGALVLVVERGALSVVPVAGKSDRRAQHRAALAETHGSPLLEPGAAATMRIREEQVLPSESSVAERGIVLPY